MLKSRILHAKNSIMLPLSHQKGKIQNLHACMYNTANLTCSVGNELHYENEEMIKKNASVKFDYDDFYEGYNNVNFAEKN